jgi:hypothetical protein
VLLNGVRKAAIALERGGGVMEMERGMTLSLRESMHLVSDPRNLDASVEEVFQLMLGVNCRRYSGPVENAEPESVTAVVGFGGLLSGACVFRSGASAAIKIAAHMTGMELAEVDDTVKDGIGEICNMLAGRDYRAGLLPARASARVQASPRLQVRRRQLRGHHHLRRTAIKQGLRD